MRLQQEPVRVGVIGVGIMGERHARLYAQLPQATLVGVFDTDQVRARSVAARWGTDAFAAVEQLLDAVDAVSIASATPTHAALATLALERGVHLLVEKPLADSLANARLLAARAAHRPDLAIQVGHIERFNPVVLELHRLLKGRRIIAMMMQRLSLFDGRCLDTDVIHDLMIHDLDLARAFCGNTLTLSGASGGSVLSPRIDTATAHLVAADGAQLTLHASRVENRKVRAIGILTEDEYLNADLLNKTITVTPRRARQEGDAAAPPGPPQAVEVRVPGDEPLSLELRHFLAAIKHGTPPRVGLDAGLAALAHAQAIGALIAPPAPAGLPLLDPLRPARGLLVANA